MQLNEIHDNHEHASTSLKTILLVFAIVLVGTLGYLVWDFNRTPETTDYSTPVAKKKTENTATTTITDETKDWKTYTNSKFGFSIKYPASGWGAYYSEVEDDFVVGSLGITPLGSQDPLMVISVDNRKLSEIITAEKEVYENGYELKDQESLEINGVTATRLAFQSNVDASLVLMRYIVPAGDYHLRINGPDNSDTENYSILLKVLNSLKVTS